MKAAIFDSDGVVVNTVPLHFKAWKRMFSEYNVKFTFDDYKKKVDGILRIDGAKAILTDLPEDELKKAVDRKQGYFLENLAKDKIKVYHSTIKLIKNLRKSNIKIALISSSRNLPLIIKKIKIDRLLDAVVNGNDITKGKPHPQIFLLAAERLRIPAGECVVFEDAVLGVEAAKNAGMKCVGIDRYRNPARLSRADKVVSDLEKINLKQLKALFK